MQEIPSQEEV